MMNFSKNYADEICGGHNWKMKIGYSADYDMLGNFGKMELLDHGCQNPEKLVEKQLESNHRTSTVGTPDSYQEISRY